MSFRKDTRLDKRKMVSTKKSMGYFSLNEKRYA